MYNGRILLVDDDSDYRASLSETLDVEGFQVTSCGSAEKALELLERDRAGFDLVIVDFMLNVQMV